jgi:hypothetical protein
MTSTQKKSKKDKAETGPKLFTRDELMSFQPKKLKRLLRNKNRKQSQLELMRAVLKEKSIMNRPALNLKGEVVDTGKSRTVGSRAQHLAYDLHGDVKGAWDENRSVATMDLLLDLSGHPSDQPHQVVHIDRVWIMRALYKMRRRLVCYDTRFVIIGLDKTSLRESVVDVVYYDRDLGRRSLILEKGTRMWSVDGYPPDITIRHKGSPTRVMITIAYQQGYPSSLYRHAGTVANIPLPCIPLEAAFEAMKAVYRVREGVHTWLLPSRIITVTHSLAWTALVNLRVQDATGMKPITSHVERFPEEERRALARLEDAPPPVDEAKHEEEDQPGPVVETWMSFVKHASGNAGHGSTPQAAVCVSQGIVRDVRGDGVKAFTVISERPGVRFQIRFEQRSANKVAGIVTPGGLLQSKDFSVTLN